MSRSGLQAGTGLGPGRLVVVVGPSGAGKDTLIEFARTRLVGDDRYYFPRRVVTRPASAAEDNEYCDPDAFVGRTARGEFSLTWTAHGLSYALPVAVDHAIAAGRVVVCNVSRRVIDPVRVRYSDVRVVEVTAPPDVLAARLAARGRKEDGDLDRRVARGAQVQARAPDVTILNVGAPEEAGTAFLAALAPRQGRPGGA